VPRFRPRLGVISGLEPLALVGELRPAPAFDPAARTIAGRDLADDLLELRRSLCAHPCRLPLPTPSPRPEPGQTPTRGSRSGWVWTILPPVMRRMLLVGCLAIALTARAGTVTEQSVEGMTPPAEQEVHGFGPAQEQVVEGIGVGA